MRNLYATLAAGIGLALLAGCITDRSAGATGVGNPTKGSVTVALVAVETPAPAKASAASLAGRNPDGSFDIKDAGGTVFTVKTGFANVGRIKIDLPDSLDCTDAEGTECESDEVGINGPWVSDLMTGAWIPDPGAVKLPLGLYKRLEVRLESQDKRGSGAPDLSRHSLVFGGTFSYQGRPDRPFTIALDFDEDARFESPAGIALDTGSTTVTVALDIAAWLSQADITACLDKGSLALGPDGGFAMDKDRGCGLEQTLKDAIKTSGSVREEEGDR